MNRSVAINNYKGSLACYACSSRDITIGNQPFSFSSHRPYVENLERVLHSPESDSVGRYVEDGSLMN